MTDVFLQIENLEVGQNALLSHIEKYVPDMHCDKLDNDCGSSSTNFIIVKTHSKYDNIRIKHEKVILLYREPEDCLISFYYHQQAKGKVGINSSISKDDFANEKITQWIDFHSSYLHSAIPISTLSYENLHANPLSSLKVLFKDLGVNASEKILLKAIERNQFKNLKGEWMLSNNDEPNHAFFRKGNSGEGTKEFSSTTLNFIRESSNETLKKLQFLHLAL